MTPVNGTPLFENAKDFGEISGWWGTALPYLAGIALGVNAKAMLEIGVRQGGSTRALLHVAEVTDGALASFDIDDCSNAVPPEGWSRWTFTQGDSRLTLPEYLNDRWNRELDFVYVDGEHTEEAVRQELSLLSPHMRPGGVIVVDDCCSAFQGVLNAFEGHWSPRIVSKTLIQYGTAGSYMGTARAMGLIRY